MLSSIMLSFTTYHVSSFILYSTTIPKKTATPAVSLPSLVEIANYPDYSQQSLLKGTKVCIMCGERCPYKKRTSTMLAPIIRPTDKCICTSCQVQVWVSCSSHYKWCNKCKKWKRVALGDENNMLLTCKDCRQKDSVSRRKRQAIEQESS